MNPPTTTPAVFKVAAGAWNGNPGSRFVVELWNGEPVPRCLCDSIRSAGFKPLAGTGTTFLWIGANWQDGARALAAMGITRIS